MAKRVKITTTNILSLNINSIDSRLKFDIFQNLIRQLDADIVLLQEVKVPNFSLLGYNIISNVTDSLGAAIAIKEDILYRNEIKTVDSIGIAITVGNTKIINIYAPSGAQAKNQRETFFSQTITTLFDLPAENTIMGGDFNCVIQPTDSLNSFNFSHSLKNLVSGLNMTDAWRELGETRVMGAY